MNQVKKVILAILPILAMHLSSANVELENLIEIETENVPFEILERLSLQEITYEEKFMGPGASIFSNRSLTNREARKEIKRSHPKGKGRPILQLNKIPEFEAPISKETRSIEGFKKKFKSLSGAASAIYHDNETYEVVNHDWFKSFYQWYDRDLRHIGVQYKPEIWDCENFSSGLVSLLDLSAIKSGFKSTESLVGWIVVYYNESWARMPAGVVHSIVIFESEKGIHVLEPQNGWMTPIEDFPNAKYIKEIFLP